jgi:Erythromycin esterase
VLVGFTTHHGTVTAASDWGKSAERKHVRPALAGSYEALFHAARRDRFLLILNDSDAMIQQLRAPRLERAIAVIYRPETERQSHYFRARLVRAIRRGAAFRRNARSQAARNRGTVGSGRASGDIPIRGLNKQRGRGPRRWRLREESGEQKRAGECRDHCSCVRLHS